MSKSASGDRPATAYAWLSIAAALVTIALKLTAWRLTGSVGLFSDAAESFVNLLAAVVALWALHLASQPPDFGHAFGHTKAEYVASAFEGAMILLAALTIGWAAVGRLRAPQPLEQVGVGLLVSCAAAAVNGLVAWVLLRAGRRLRSITLEADAHHLMTDVWTSAGVLAGVALVKLTGWLVLDPLVALAVAANIVRVGVRLLVESGHGILDAALLPQDQQALEAALAPFRRPGVDLHGLKTRRSGRRRFVEMHVVVPGAWSVKQGHDLCEEIEDAVVHALPGSTVMTHLEPIEDPVSFGDEGLDRPSRSPG